MIFIEMWHRFQAFAAYAGDGCPALMMTGRKGGAWMKRRNQYTEFGQWLRLETMKRNLTLRELAVLAGIDHRVVSDVMVGRNKGHQEELREALNRYDEGKTA